MKGNKEYCVLKTEYNASVAELVRSNLEAYHLDLPGTVYFDEGLDHLSDFYDHIGRVYYVLLEHRSVIGGVGLAEFKGFKECCELQKLYLSESAKGKGLGYDMAVFIEKCAKDMGYKRIYLETYTKLQEAINLYEYLGYREIPRPENVVHSTMNKFYLKEL